MSPGKNYKEMLVGDYMVAREPEEEVEISGIGEASMF